MNNQLTVLIPTSPIPSHPSTALIEETIANIRQYTDAKIIIMCDGVHVSLEHREADYRQYISTLQSRKQHYGECEIIIHDTHKHQAIMTREVLAIVNTPLVMFCEHDTSPIGEIPFGRICEFMIDSDLLNYIRFNIFHAILDEHQYLMLDKEPMIIAEDYSGGERTLCIKAVRTIQWSQRPHIARTKWYRNILWDHFQRDKRTMIEDVMHSIVQEKYKAFGYDTFGLGIYTPDGNQLRSYHSDGREDDTKIIEG